MKKILAAAFLTLAVLCSSATVATAAPSYLAPPTRWERATFDDWFVESECITAHLFIQAGYSTTHTVTYPYTEVTVWMMDTCHLDRDGQPTVAGALYGDSTTPTLFGPASGSASFHGDPKGGDFYSGEPLPMHLDADWVATGPAKMTIQAGPTQFARNEFFRNAERPAAATYRLTVGDRTYSGVATGTIVRGQYLLVVVKG